MTKRSMNRAQSLKEKNKEDFSPEVWGGIVNLVNSLVATGALAVKFPAICPSSHTPIGTDEDAVGLAVQAEIPGLKWPLETTCKIHHGFFISQFPFAPETPLVLDLIEFCYRIVAKPIQDFHHEEYAHYHLKFDEAAGKQEFLEDVNRILSRNNMVYELADTGQVVKRTSKVPLPQVSTVRFHTEDSTLDEMLNEAHRTFLNPDPSVHRTSVELLWECWEKIQSLPLQKTDNEDFLSLLDTEAKTLTKVGDTFHLRHSDSKATAVADPAQIDYLFHRLSNLIQFLFSQEKANFQAPK